MMTEERAARWRSPQGACAAHAVTAFKYKFIEVSLWIAGSMGRAVGGPKHCYRR